MRVARNLPVLAFLPLLLLASGPDAARAGNVTWSLGDSVTTCPAGDSVVAGRPSLLRIPINYKNGSGQNRAGVPPESVWVTIAPLANNWVLLYDATSASDGFTWKVFADDATTSSGDTRVTVTGFAGHGSLYVRLYVSGVNEGTTTVQVRSLDVDGHDPVTADFDSIYAVDFNYDGSINSADYALLHTHEDHGHRNALHGTLVRITSLCDTCSPGHPNTLGEGVVTWNPASSRLTFSVFDLFADCSVFITPADPAAGHTLTRISFPDSGKHDYDPDWSPLGDAIAFDRADSTCYLKGIPGLAADTSLRRVTTYNNGEGPPRGDVMPAVSPDGKWVAFIRKAPSIDHTWHLWKIGIGGIGGGATATQLTSTTYGSDLYPRWAPDGQKIYFGREEGDHGPIRIFSINADGTGLDSVLVPTGVFAAATPAVSPDGKILTVAVGDVDSVKTRTLDLGLGRQTSLQKTVENYSSFHVPFDDDFPILSPRLSPDGTRLALRALPPGVSSDLPEIWASRRNMSLPPSITALGGQSVNNDLPVVDFTATRGEPFSLVVEASDPEGDQLTYKAYSLRTDLGMGFNIYNQTFSWTPPDTVDLNQTYNVRFQVETYSGGVDYAIARIAIALGGPGGGCPTLATYTGRGWRTENTLLGRAKDGRLITDVYKLHEKPARVHDRYGFEIRENENEKTTLDQVRLLAVDHDPKLQTFATESGVWLGERQPAHRVRTQGGLDVTELLNGKSGGFLGNPGDVLLVEMDDPEGGTLADSRDGPGIFEEPCCEKEGPQPGSLKPVGAVTAAAIDAAVLDRSGVAVEAADPSGIWGALRSLYPREHGDEAVVEGAGHGLVRVTFQGKQHLTFAGKLAGATRVTPQDLPLAIARHSRLKDVAEAVAAQGGKVTTIEPGETLSLEFGAPAIPDGSVRDLFLVSRGVYTANLPSAGTAGLPIRFALAQSQPNPFAKGTRIRFELPVKAKVKLEVFDLLGRRVQVLADREFEAGYQSVEWDRRDRSGTLMSAGVYLYRMTAPGFRDQKKMTLLP